MTFCDQRYCIISKTVRFGALNNNVTKDYCWLIIIRSFKTSIIFCLIFEHWTNGFYWLVMTFVMPGLIGHLFKYTTNRYADQSLMYPKADWTSDWNQFKICIVICHVLKSFLKLFKVFSNKIIFEKTVWVEWDLVRLWFPIFQISLPSNFFYLKQKKLVQHKKT